MAIFVEHLIKTYGTQNAIDDLSFEAPKGKITGFLGPNGAGKSTTMKIATGYLLPSSGQVRVDGWDVVAEPLKVKKCTGYLAEHNPLYPDMYVREFLRFVASIYRVPQRKQRVEEMIARIGLTRESNKKIGQLSKGYRQRVGLAQALIHDPSVLILDEPTTGLDPNQIVEIRQVIKELSQDKTVILSTHIMQEVEALCDQVVIIDKGRIVANDTLDGIKSLGQSTDHFVLTFEEAIDAAIFAEFHPEIHTPKQLWVPVIEGVSRERLLEVVAAHRLPLEGISKQKSASLEEVFHQLTLKSDA